MTDRAYIEERCARYLHRGDFTPADFSAAIDATTRELGQTLRCPENEEVIVYASGALLDPQPLPALLRQIRTLERAALGSPATLEPVPRAFMNQWAVSGGLPAFYLVLNGALMVRPFGTPEITVYFYAEPDPIGLLPADTNRVLSAYPELYVWRCLSELSMITQDVELVTGYREAFAGRVSEINQQAKNAQYSQPAMRSV